jgi:hypothetical protein
VQGDNGLSTLTASYEFHSEFQSRGAEISQAEKHLQDFLKKQLQLN